MIAAEPIVDWGALLDVLWASLIGGVGLTAVFAFALLGGVRLVDARAAGRGGAALAYGTLAVVCVAVVLASVVFAVSVIRTG